MNFRVCRFCHCCLFDWTYWPTLYDWSEQYAVWGRESDVFTVIILTTLCDRHQGAHWSWDGHCACVLYPRSHHLQHTHTASQSDALILPYIAQYGAAPCSESVHLSSVTDKKSWQEILQLARGLSYWKGSLKVVFKMLYSLLSRKIATAYSDTNDVMAQNYSDKNECQSTINHGAVNGKFIFPFMNHKAKILYSISR